MNENPYASSLETKVLSATPIELVNMLYHATIEAVQAARLQLSRGQIFERGRSVSKAIAILAELNGSLDHEKGGEVSTRLAVLYDFLQRTLLDANFRQSDEGFEKAETLLRTLCEAWSAIIPPKPRVPMSSNAPREPQLASYGFASIPTPVEECAATAARQWCA